MRVRGKKILNALSYLLTAAIVLWLYGWIQDRGQPATKEPAKRESSRDLSGSLSVVDFKFEEKWKQLPNATGHVPTAAVAAGKTCSMYNCFDFSKCQGEFKFYIYPVSADALALKQSNNFKKIYNSLQRNRHITSNPQEACIFIPLIDLLDRDKLSPNFIPKQVVQKALNSSPFWNHGKNNLIFNLFSGSYPAYSEFLDDIDTGMAIVAKTSMSLQSYRRNFDVSLPLVKLDHPEVHGEPSSVESCGSLYPIMRKYLLSFKGKRYLYGIGTETRSAFHHLHNGRDVVAVTTCKHGTGWEHFKDKFCDRDMELYNQYDYGELLYNSTFCAVPRGRRLASYRMLEAVQAGCVPVSLSNSYVLPFEEVLDWSKFAFVLDERRLLELPRVLRNVSGDKVFDMRMQMDFVWNAYFSSLQKIVDTAIEIIHDRVKPHQARDRFVWSNFPGGLAVDPVYSVNLGSYPFYNPHLLKRTEQKGYTVVVRSESSGRSQSLTRLLKAMVSCRRLVKVIVEWSGEDTSKPTNLPSLPVPLELRRIEKSTQWVPPYLDDVSTDAILLVDQEAELHSQEMEFAFDVWYHHQQQIVGFYPLRHDWDKEWSIGTNVSSGYSMMFTGVAMVHRYYLYLLKHLSPSLLSFLSAHPSCEDVFLNALVSSVSRKPPALVPKIPPALPAGIFFEKKIRSSETLRDKETCLKEVFRTLGSGSLSYSISRLTPALYHTPAGMFRKEYPAIEKAL